MLPVVLNVAGKRAVIFGGGSVAERRAAKLLEAGSRVRVVSKDFTKNLKGLSKRREDLELIEQHLESKDVCRFMENSDLVLIATNDGALNDAIEREARAMGKLVNRADALADFSFPAVLDLGNAVISISTMGRSPAVAKAIKARLKKAISKEELLQVELQEYAKEVLKGKVRDQRLRREILREALNSQELLVLLKKGKIDRAKRAIEEICDAHHKR